MFTTRIIKVISNLEFKKLLSKCKSVYISPHAIDHLSEGQRKVFKKEGLVKPLFKEIPSLAGLQRNGRYAVFFSRKWGFLKLILVIKESKLEIITFINTESLPNLTGIKNEN